MWIARICEHVALVAIWECAQRLASTSFWFQATLCPLRGQCFLALHFDSRSDSNTFMSQKWACHYNFDLHRGYLYSRSERRRMKKSACSLPDPCTWPWNFTWQEPEQWTPKYLWQRSSPWGGFSPVSRWAPASQSTRQRSAVAPLTKKIGGKELFKDNRLHE